MPSKNIYCCTAITSALVALASPSFSEAAEIYSRNGTFQASGQSQWGNHSALKLDETQFLGVEFDTGRVSFGDIGEGLFGDKYGARASIDVSGRLGLESNYTVDGGSLDLRLPFETSLDLRKETGSTDIFLLNPDFSIASTGSSFDANVPRFTFESKAIIEMQNSIRVDACIIDCFLQNVEIVPVALRDFSAEIPLLSYDSSGSLSAFGTAPKAGFEVTVPLEPPLSATIGLQVNVPSDPSIGEPSIVDPNDPNARLPVNVVTQIKAGVKAGVPNQKAEELGLDLSVGTDLATLRLNGPNQNELGVNLDGSAAKNFLLGNDAQKRDQTLAALTLDMDAMAASLGLPLPPGGGRFGVGPVGVVVDIIDFEFGPAFGLEQTLDFAPNANLTLVFDRAVDVNGQFTSQVTVDAASASDLRIKANRELGVTPIFKLAPEVSNNLDLTVAPITKVSALSGALKFKGATVASFDPLFEKNITEDVAPLKLADLFEDTFGVNGSGGQITNLPSFVIAQGVTLDGQSAANPLTGSNNGDETTYTIDHSGNIDTNNKLVDGSVFAGPNRDYGVDTPASKAGVIRAGDADRFSDLSGPITVSTDGSLPTEFRDDFVGSGFDVHYSDLVTDQKLRRSGGLGADTPIYLNYDLLRQNPTTGNLDFTRGAEISLDAMLNGSRIDRPSEFGLRFDDVAYGGGSLNDLLAFESVVFDQGAQSHVGRLLDAIGDTNGLQLKISFGDGGIDQGAGGGRDFTYSFDPRRSDCGADFSRSGNHCIFNFGDDFLFSEDELFEGEQFLTDGLTKRLGFDSHVGLWEFKIDGLDINLDDSFTDTLFKVLEPSAANGNKGVEASLNFGITFNDPVSYLQQIGSCSLEYRIPGFFTIPGTCSDRDENRTITARGNIGPQETISYVTGVDETTKIFENAQDPLVTIDGTGATKSFSSRPAGSPPPIAIPAPAYIQSQVEQVNTECIQGDCGNRPVEVITVNPITGETEKKMLSATQFLTEQKDERPMSPTLPSEPELDPQVLFGMTEYNPLGPTGGTGLSYLFDFENVEGWGDAQRYAERVFRGDNLTAAGEPCSNVSIAGLVDGAVIGRSPEGLPLPAPIGLDPTKDDLVNIASCFEAQSAERIFGQESTVFLELPFAPIFDFSVEGPLFTSVSLPLFGGDNLLLQQGLSVLVFDNFLQQFIELGVFGAGESFVFLDPVSNFRISGLDISFFELGDIGAAADPFRNLVFGFTLSEAGTIITAVARSEMPTPGTLILLSLGLLMFRRRR